MNLHFPFLQNQKYYAALKKAIKKKRDQNEPVNVLDIGTGTGLLSMMAATIGADSITACEVSILHLVHMFPKLL